MSFSTFWRAKGGLQMCVCRSPYEIFLAPGGGGGEGAIAPPWGQKNFIGRPKNTHLQTPFCTPECAKTHLQQSRNSKFSGGGPPDPLFKGREGKGRRGRGKGSEEGRGRIGRGRKEGGRGGMGVGRGGEGRSTWAPPPPPRDELWIRPCRPQGLLSLQSLLGR